MGERNRRDFLAASLAAVPAVLAVGGARAQSASSTAPRQASESRGRPLRALQP